jgi:hypothetical protein
MDAVYRRTTIFTLAGKIFVRNITVTATFRNKVLEHSHELIVALLSNVGVLAQAKEAMNIYTDAKPYKDDPLPLLKMEIKELDGLRAEANQANLTTIIDRVGEVIVAQMPWVPNLIAQEDVAQEQQPPAMGLSAGSLAANARMQMDRITQAGNTQNETLIPQNWNRFEYVILAKKQNDGGIIFDESRKYLDKRGCAATPRGIGFGSLWLMFVPSNRGGVPLLLFGHTEPE